MPQVCYNKFMKTYIVSDPKILGGAPVIKGTRIPIERVKFLINDGFNLEGIHKQYPHVSMNTLRGVLDELFAIKNSSNVSLS